MRHMTICLAIGACTVVPSHAQTIPEQIDSVISDQSEIIRRYSAPRKPGAIDLAVTDARKAVKPEQAEKTMFTLRSITVRGAVTVSGSTLRRAWAAELNKRISLADLYAIAERIDELYERSGYFSWAVIPEQDFSSGDITIVLYESYVRQVIIDSSIPGIEERLKPYIDRIVAMRPIRIKEVERVLLLMSDLAGLSIEGTIIRPETPSAGGDLRLEIGFKRAGGGAVVDNFGSEAVGPIQLTGTGTLNDALRLFDATNVALVTIPDTPDELKFALASQDIPLGYDGVHVGYNVGYVSSQPGGDLSPLDLDIASTFGAAYASYPVLRIIDHSLFARLELNFKNNSLDAAGEPQTAEDLRWLVASLKYVGQLENGAVAATASYGQGLSGVGASSGADPLAPRPGLPDDYRYFRGDVDFTKEIAPLVAAHFRVAAQYTPTALPSSLQLSLGGDPYGLAFDGSAASGDSGIATSLELGRTIELPEDLPISNLSVFAFVDYGAVWNRDTGVQYTEA
jgi:hemolysin activation/secretion protein